MSDLETQIEKLTQENQQLRTQVRAASTGEIVASPGTYSLARHGNVPAESPATSDASSNHVQDLVKSVRNVVVEPSRQPRFLGQSGGITLARLVMAAICVDTLPSPLFAEQRSYDTSTSALAAEASLPPRQAANHLVEVYFQYRTPHLPIVGRSQVQEAVQNVYLYTSSLQISDQLAATDIFMTYMIFAIALCDVSNPSGGRPSQSEGCFRSAIGWIEKVITYAKSDIETLRAVLLLAQFVALYPSRGSLWHLAGIALRISIDIGLHWETEEQRLNMDPILLHDRRRLWYSTYQFDRVLCITLGRPFGIIEESMRVPLPNPWAIPRQPRDQEHNEFDIHNQRAHNHLFRLSQLESEIKHVQHTQAFARIIAYPKANYSVWLRDIQPRLEEWYATIPEPSRAHPSSIFAYQAYWDMIYNNSILLLHRPNATVPQASSDTFRTSFEASCKLIASIKALQREGKIDVLWKSVHQLFMAGLGVIYDLWHSKEIRDRYPVTNSISTLQSCTSTLSALAESFPGAAGCRDAFEILSAATVDWLVNSDAEEIRRTRHDFEKQAEDLLQQLQPARDGNETNTIDMSTMLSSENFAFSEMLSSAAQWPDLHDMIFGDINTDSALMPGLHENAYPS